MRRCWEHDTDGWYSLTLSLSLCCIMSCVYKARPSLVGGIRCGKKIFGRTTRNGLIRKIVEKSKAGYVKFVHFRKFLKIYPVQSKYILCSRNQPPKYTIDHQISTYAISINSNNIDQKVIWNIPKIVLWLGQEADELGSFSFPEEWDGSFWVQGSREQNSRSW